MEREIDPTYHATMIKEYKKAKELVPNLECEHKLIQTAKDGNTIAEKILFYLNYPLLIKYVNPRNFDYFQGSILELYAVAYDGVKSAVKNFDFNIGGHFSNTFIPHALCRVRKYISMDKLIHVPENAQKTTFINVSSLNDYVKDSEDSQLEVIDTIADTNNTETELSIPHMEEDIQKMIKQSEDKDILTKIFKEFKIYGGDSTNGHNDFSKSYIKTKIGISGEKLRKIQKRFRKLTTTSNTEV